MTIANNIFITNNCSDFQTAEVNSKRLMLHFIGLSAKAVGHSWTDDPHKHILSASSTHLSIFVFVFVYPNPNVLYVVVSSNSRPYSKFCAIIKTCNLITHHTGSFHLSIRNPNSFFRRVYHMLARYRYGAKGYHQK